MIFLIFCAWYYYCIGTTTVQVTPGIHRLLIQSVVMIHTLESPLMAMMFLLVITMNTLLNSGLQARGIF